VIENETQGNFLAFRPFKRLLEGHIGPSCEVNEISLISTKVFSGVPLTWRPWGLTVLDIQRRQGRELIRGKRGGFV
jgi:hypothetical protein